MSDQRTDDTDAKRDNQSGSPGTGPSTGISGRSEDSTSGVSPQEAAERIGSGGGEGGSGFADPTPPDEEG